MFGRHAHLPVDVMIAASPAAGGATSGGWIQAHNKTVLQAFETIAKHAQTETNKGPTTLQSETEGPTAYAW